MVYDSYARFSTLRGPETGTEGVRPYFVQSSGVLGRILRLARKERDESTVRMVTDTLDPLLKILLVRKDFESEEDTRKLETIAGSLSAGLLILLHALPRGSRNPKIAVPSLPNSKGSMKRTRSDRQFFGDVYELTFVFVTSMLNKHEAKYHGMEKALTDPAESSAEGDAVPVEVAEKLCSEPGLDSLFTRKTFRHCADSLDYATFKLAQGISRVTCEQSNAPPSKNLTSTLRTRNW